MKLPFSMVVYFFAQPVEELREVRSLVDLGLIQSRDVALPPSSNS